MAKSHKRLEEVLNLPSMTSDAVVLEESADMLTVINQAKSITAKSKHSTGLAKHDDEMDELASMAITAHKDLMELGLNVELRHAGEILGTAGTMLKIAVDAKNNKVEKLLRAMKLELDTRKLDAAIEPKEEPINGTVQTEQWCA